jgi:hypothetical protein
MSLTFNRVHEHDLARIAHFGPALAIGQDVPKVGHAHVGAVLCNKPVVAVLSEPLALLTGDADVLQAVIAQGVRQLHPY